MHALECSKPLGAYAMDVCNFSGMKTRVRSEWESVSRSRVQNCRATSTITQDNGSCCKIVVDGGNLSGATFGSAGIGIG